MKCCICKEEIDTVFQDVEGNTYCSEECFEKRLPHCSYCGNLLTEWIEVNGQAFCNEKCYQESFPVCSLCGKKMKKWIEDKLGKKYCDINCYK